MNIAKIKAALKKDTETEFIYTQYSGNPEPRHSTKAIVVSSKRVSWSQFQGYSDNELTPSDVTSVMNAPEYIGTTGYYLLVKLLLPNKDVYVMTKPSNIKGFYADVEKQWAKEKQLYAIVDRLKQQHQKIVAELAGIVKTKEALELKELVKFLSDVGISEKEAEKIGVRADISINFAKKHYPELEHLSNLFSLDLDNYETQVSYRVMNFPYEHLQAISEVVHTLRQTNLDLAKELDREKRLNATR
jgi:hypothetical protein